MNYSIRFPKKVSYLLAYIIALPVFFMAFSLLYNPFDIHGFYTFGSHSVGFHLTILACIQLVVISSIRVPLHFVMKGRRMSIFNYLLICIGELFICSCFMALYSQLINPMPRGWFQSLGQCQNFCTLILCYPSLFFLMYHIIGDINEDRILAGAGRTADNLVKFYDEHKRLKLTIASSAILYVEAQANYVSVHYLESDRPKDFLLRCSMKSIEENITDYGFVRCHRSFIVNPTRVRVLRKETDGLTYAELDVAGINPVPVSKQYFDFLSSKL